MLDSTASQNLQIAIVPFKLAPEFDDFPDEDLGEGLEDWVEQEDQWYKDHPLANKVPSALIDQARECDMVTVAQAHGVKLRRSGGEYIGACPVCGTGDDRFAINPGKRVFLCRKCHPKGGSGAIDLEMFISGCEFVGAVRRLTNTTSLSTPHRTDAKVVDISAQRERENEQYEAKQHQKASWLWARRQPAAGSPVEHYLRARGYTGTIPPTIGYLPARGEHLHAMISALALPNEVTPGELDAPLVVQSVHLTKLNADGSDRIREKGAKIIVGRPLGLPIAISPITDGLSLAITEGAEDAFAYRAVGFAAWAAGNAGLIPTLVDNIPDSITTLIVEQHVDPAAERAIAELQALLHERPIKIIIRKAVMIDGNKEDAADILQKQGAEALRTQLDALTHEPSLSPEQKDAVIDHGLGTPHETFGGFGLIPVEQPQIEESSTKPSMPPLIVELGMKLWGPVTLNNDKEYRYGADHSKVIDIRRGAWFDFTTNEGGFIKDLMKKLETAAAPIEQAPDYNQSDGAVLGYSWHLTWHGETDPADTRKALVQDLLPETGVALISGQWGTYKTFIAADLCAAVMTQTTFANKQVMRKGGVLFIACEGQSEIEIRLTAAFRKHGGIGNAPFAWVQGCPRLLDPNASKILAAMVEHAAIKMMQDFGLPVAIVIIDTAGKAAGLSKQGELNDDAIAKMIMSRLAEASTQTGALFVGVAHFGKNIETGTKGSSGFEDDADAVLALLGDRGVNGIVPNPVMCARKRRSGPNGEEFSFQTEDAEVGPEKTLTIRWTAAPTPKAKKKDNPWAAKSLRHLHQALTNALADYGSQQRPYPDGPVVKAVDIELVRTEFYKTYPATGDQAAKKEARKKAFNRAIGTADHKGLIGTRDIGSITFIWFAQENEEGELIPTD